MDLTSFQSLLLCIPPHYSSQVLDLFVVHTLHMIWMSQNTLWFSLNTATIHAARVWLHSLVGMSGNLSVGKCLASYALLLDSFSVSHHNRLIKGTLCAMIEGEYRWFGHWKSRVVACFVIA